MQDRFNMFDIKKIKKFNNIEYKVFKYYTTVIEKLDGGFVYYTIENDRPFVFNHHKFEREQDRQLKELLEEL